MCEISNFLQSHVVERSRNLGTLNKQLGEKNARLREQLKEAKRDAQQEREQHDAELDEANARLAAALSTNAELRTEITKGQGHLVDALLELQFVNAMREEVEKRHGELVALHDQVMQVMERAKNENVALRDGNTRFLAEIKRLNAQLNE